MAVPKESSCGLEKCPQHVFDIGWKLRLNQGVIHQFQPAVAGGFSDRKWRVTDPEAGMAALLNVPRWSSKPEDQEVSQALFSAGEIAGRIHGTKQFVGRHLAVKGGDQP